MTVIRGARLARQWTWRRRSGEGMTSVGTGASAAAAKGITRRDLVLLVALIAVAVVIPLALFVATGAIDIAHNDDFSYRRAALGLYSSGEI